MPDPMEARKRRDPYGIHPVSRARTRKQIPVTSSRTQSGTTAIILIVAIILLGLIFRLA
jgi:hypothetical protein